MIGAMLLRKSVSWFAEEAPTRSRRIVNFVRFAGMTLNSCTRKPHTRCAGHLRSAQGGGTYMIEPPQQFPLHLIDIAISRVMATYANNQQWVLLTVFSMHIYPLARPHIAANIEMTICNLSKMVHSLPKRSFGWFRRITQPCQMPPQHFRSCSNISIPGNQKSGIVIVSCIA